MNPRFYPWLLILLSLLYISTLVYFYGQINFLRQQIPVSIPTPILTPTNPVVPTIPAEPTIIIPTTTKSSPTPKPTSVTTLNYLLPSGWSEVKLDNSLFSIGYDPSTMNITQNNPSGLFIRYNSTKYSYADFIAQEKLYNGGSRHSFIYNIIGGNVLQDRLPGYHEKEYKINGVTCLFLIGIQPSQSLPTWGMCPISNTKAIFINMLVLDDGSIEKMLKTIKFTGKVTSTITYQNSANKFSFQYPNVYSIQDTGGGAKTANGNVILASFTTQDQKTLEVLLDSSPFNLNNLKKYAPTGQEDFPPNQSIEFTSPQFYYYGPGGGGVCYPDQYITEINGQILILRFSGCDDDKTPAQTYKEYEHQILRSFRFL